jgi:hypothetical protein
MMRINTSFGESNDTLVDCTKPTGRYVDNPVLSNFKLEMYQADVYIYKPYYESHSESKDCSAIKKIKK